MLRSWLHLDEVDLKRDGQESKGLSTYLISNIPEFLMLSINRFSTPDARNDTDVIITKTIKPFTNSSNQDIKNIEWSFHSAICHKGTTPRSGHYYSLLFSKKDDKDVWYLFDDLITPSLIEVSMEDKSVTSEIKKDCVFLVYQLKF